MPSPFPGMDPYLEDPRLWPGIHQRLITYLGDTLTALLPHGYIANIGERLYVEEIKRDIYPDGAILKRARRRQPRRGKHHAVAVAEPDPPWVIQEWGSDPIRETFIEILPIGDEKRVITILEILSPTNKAAGTVGRRQYLAKQELVLASASHLVEIDLLRA